MKYLKNFKESYLDDLKILYPNRKYKINDYIVFNRDLYSFNKIVIIKDKPYQIIHISENDFDSIIIILDDNNEESSFNYFDDRFKKISKEEADFLLNINKYNL